MLLQTDPQVVGLRLPDAFVAISDTMAGRAAGELELVFWVDGTSVENSQQELVVEAPQGNGKELEKPEAEICWHLTAQGP